MENMLGTEVKVVGFKDNGERYLVAKGILTGFFTSDQRGLVELKLSHEGMLRLVKLSEGMVVEENHN